MKNFILGLAFTFVLTSLGLAQTASTSGSSNTTGSGSVSKEGAAVDLSTAATVTGQLQNSLNVEKAKVGDEVVLKTTKDVKQNGQTVIEKGSRLIGRVTEVSQKGKDKAGSEIGVLFDTLKQGNTTTPITATILSVTKAAATVPASDPFATDMSTSSSTRATTSSSSGGLLGGVGNTVNGVANTATTAAGGVTNTALNTTGGLVNTAGQTTGSAVGSLGSNIRGLQISQSADANASGSTTLSSNTGNLKLDSGTNFTLNVTGSAPVKNEQ